jgi:hypothetical protein
MQVKPEMKLIKSFLDIFNSVAKGRNCTAHEKIYKLHYGIVYVNKICRNNMAYRNAV